MKEMDCLSEAIKIITQEFYSLLFGLVWFMDGGDMPLMDGISLNMTIMTSILEISMTSLTAENHHLLKFG